MQVEEIFARLIAFDTTSSKPNRPCIDFIRDYLDGFGIASTLVASDDGNKANLWATIGASGQSGVALSGHTDVVPVEGQQWESDPFMLTRREDKFFGRGTADMKGFIACALAFVPEFLAAGTGDCFHLSLTADEETDMSGAMRLTDYLTSQEIKPLWTWLGEPTGLTIIDQHKGHAVCKTSVTGAPGHSGYPDKGVNAIELTAQFITIVSALGREKKESPFPASRFDQAYTTFNMGVIAGGTAENIIAEHCELLWDMRIHPGDAAKDIAAEIEKRARVSIAPRFAAFAPTARMETCICVEIPPFASPPENLGIQTLQRALKRQDTRTVGFATEAGIFQKLGASAVVCGPGFIEHAHQGNEFIDKNQVMACVDLMRSVLLSSLSP